MKVLVPIDSSECSVRALRFATDFVRRYDGTLHVVHVTDRVGDETAALLNRAEEILDEADVLDHPEVVTDLRMREPRYANRVGKDILDIVAEEGYDHVVMGHHGTGTVGRILLGSAAETVVRAGDTPATVVP